jgi:hypothetical protein
VQEQLVVRRFLSLASIVKGTPSPKVLSDFSMKTPQGLVRCLTTLLEWPVISAVLLFHSFPSTSIRNWCVCSVDQLAQTFICSHASIILFSSVRPQATPQLSLNEDIRVRDSTGAF